MRFLLFLLFVTPALAQIDVGNGTTDCDENSFGAAPGPYECRNVTINIASLDPADLFDATVPLVIKATGTVTITNDINFEGQPGATNTAPPAFGGAGGPGAGQGGDYIGSADPGAPGTRGGRQAASAGNCPDTDGLNDDQGEGAGGGGGSLVLTGVSGGDGLIAVDEGTPGDAGVAGTTTTFDISNFTFAGSGGGAGEFGCSPPTSAAQIPGAGGGGGGGIHILARGNVTISGDINAFGGDGGDGVLLGGGGGGGSGGIIVIQSLGQIDITGGNLIARAGQGGAGGATADGYGGDGADGIVILQDADGIITGHVPGVNVSPSPSIDSLGSGPRSRGLKSDISCGYVKEKDPQAFEQIFLGLALMLLGTKILSRLQGLVAKKTASPS